MKTHAFETTQTQPEGAVVLVEQEFSTTLVPANIKAGMKACDAGSRDLWQIEPSRLRIIEGFNPRVMNAEYQAHIRSLADSIKSEGYYQDQPMAGYVASLNGEPVVYIYSGHSRLAATLLAISEGAEIRRVPVVVSQAGLSMEDMTVALMRGNGGKSLTYYESAVVCKRLVKYGMSEEEVAERVGLTLPLVKHRLALMSAPLRLREMVASNEMSATLAIELLTKHGDKALEVALHAKARAEEAGKDKVRKAQTGEVSRNKLVKRSAPRLYEAAASVRRDPAFASLSPEVRELVQALIEEIEAQGGEPDVDPRQVPMDLEA